MPLVMRSSPPRPRLPDFVAELRYRVSLDDIVKVGYFTECTGLSFDYETTQYKEGGNNGYVHTLVGHMKYPNIVLKRGITQERKLIDWATKTRPHAQPQQRIEMTIELMSTGGVTVSAWTFLDAFPIKWTGPNLNASSNQIATETLEVVHNGFAPVSAPALPETMLV